MSEFPAHLFRMDGDPSLIRGSADRWMAFGEAATNAATQIRSLDTSQFVGPEGDLYREGLNAEMPEHLDITGEAFSMVAEALSTFAGTLDSLQQQMRPLAERAPRLWEAVQAARARVAEAEAADRAHAEQAANRPTDAPPDNYRSDTPAATAALSDAEAAWQECVDSANSLRSQLQTAVSNCVSVINEAEDMRFRENPRWWDLPGHFTNFVRDHADALANLSGALKIVSTVAGVLSFIPVLAPVMGPIAAGAGILSLAIDASLYAATGQGSLTSLLIDTALTVVPFGRLASLANRSGLLRNITTAIPHGLDIAGGMRGAVRNPRLFARATHCRFTGRDPIDMASGEMILPQVDLELPGVLPLKLERIYRSAYTPVGWYGTGWSSTLDQRLEVDPEGVCFAATDGLILVFPTPPASEEIVWPSEGPRLALRVVDESYTVTDPATGQTLHFPAPPPELEAAVLPLAAITDRRGNRMDFIYDSTGALTEIIHSGGYHLEITTERGRITAIRLRGGDGVLLRYEYDDRGRLIGVINSSGQPLRFEYDRAGRMTAWQDRNGTRYEYTYDEAGRVVHTRGSQGFLDGRIEYDTTNRVTTEINSLGYATRYYFNDALQIERVVDPLGNATVYEWDRYDRKTAETDSLGRTTRWSYDDAGNLIAVTRPDGATATATYNHLGLPVDTTDVDGAVWRREWDDAGNLLSVTDPAGATTTYTYDEAGRLTSVTDPTGATYRIQCDAAGLPVQITDPLGAVLRYERDAFGRVATFVDPVGGVTRYTYNPEGRLVARLLPDGASETWRYDAEGNLIEHVDVLGQATRFEVTHFDLPSARVTPDGARLEFTYDTELRLVAVTNPQSLVWRYEYDPAGRLISETDFNGRTLYYTLDAAGQLIARTNGAGETIRYDRDATGAVIAEHTPEGVTTFAYDRAGRLLRAASPDAELTFTRDPLGRILTETCNGRTVTYRYDALGRRIGRVTPAGVESIWEYGAGEQPVALHTSGQSLRFMYDAAGREILRRTDAGFSLAQSWDANHRLTSQLLLATRRWDGGSTAPGSPAGTAASVGQARLVQRRAYFYRTDGHLSRVEDQLTGPRTFDLDPVGRVTAVRGTDWSERYAYDPIGNLTEALWPDEPSPGPLGAHVEQGTRGGRRYRGTLIQQAGAVRYEYDAQGRVVLRQQKRLSAKPLTWRYTWNSQDQLTEVVTPSGERWRYRYDPLGRRIAKERLNSEGAVIEHVTFVWDGAVLAEQTETRFSTAPTGDGRPSALDGRITVWEWMPGTFRPVAQIEQPSPPPSSASPVTAIDTLSQAEIDQRFYAIVTDLTGTPAELVTPSGELAWHIHTTLWGTTYTADGDATCPLRFPGQYHDPETGLHYNFFRYYDPSTAHYLSADLLGVSPNPNNAHAYVSNPLTWTDPLGLAPYIRVSPKHSDWGDKGAHIHIGGREVRIFPDHRGGIGAEPIRLRSGSPTPQQVQEALDALHTQRDLRKRLIQVAREVMNEMNAGTWGYSQNRAAELHFLVRALEQM